MVSSTTTIKAVAVAFGIASVLAAGAYAIAAPTIALTPNIITLTSSQTQAFIATIVGSSNTAVTWTLRPALGSISTAGVYTAPALIVGPQTVTITAASVADSSAAASATVALTPGSVTLRPSQTQTFTAAVTGMSYTAVIWSMNPAVGGISAAGVYTAPASIASAQTVTVTATSVADSTKSARANVSLVVPTLSINATSVAFSNVVVNTAATRSVTLTSTGTAPVTINGITLTGPGFTLSGPTLPITLAPNQETTLDISFDPTAAGAASGQLTITSNSSTNITALISLSGTATSSFANVSIEMTPGVAIPATFMGLSHEWGSAQTMMGDSTTGVDNIYRQLLKNLTAYGSGPIVLRIGGLSTDESGEPTSTTAQPFAELASALGVHFYLGVNFASDNVNLAADQAKAYISQMPTGSLDAIEIGNEPDDYADEGLRPSPYTFQEYLAEFNTWKTNIMPLLPSGTKLMGPSWACACHLTNAQPFDAAEANVLGPFSQHYYAENGAVSNPVDILLTPSAATSGPSAAAAAVATAHQYGIPFRIGEMNSIDLGGKAGISNAFESALWAIDTMFEYANVGVDGVNWQGVADGGASYNPFRIATGSSAGKTTYTLISVNPIYYGYLFFQQATGNSAHLLPVTLSTQTNLKAWATVDASGTPRLVLINKDENSTGTVDITLSGYHHAQIFRLTAPSYLSTSGVSFAGHTFDGSTNGVIQGTQTAQSVDVSNGVFQIPMPITSAALVVFTK